MSDEALSRPMVLFLVLLVGLFSVVMGVLFWFAWPDKPTAAKASLQETWEGRTLILRPDGCIELTTEHGRRTFIYQNRQWRECAPLATKKPR